MRAAVLAADTQLADQVRRHRARLKHGTYNYLHGPRSTTYTRRLGRGLPSVFHCRAMRRSAHGQRNVTSVPQAGSVEIYRRCHENKPLAAYKQFDPVVSPRQSGTPAGDSAVHNDLIAARICGWRRNRDE